MELSVVIPIYKSSKTIGSLLDKLFEILPKNFESFEVICVDDCSPDNSNSILLDYKKKYTNKIKIIELISNVGQHRATFCGLSHSSGNYIVTIDADYQQPPEFILNMYNDLKNDTKTDVIIAKFNKKKHSLLRNIGTFVVKKIVSKSLNVPKHLELTSFRCLRKSIVDEVVKIKIRMPVLGYLIFYITNKVKNLNCEHKLREEKSSYSIFKLIRLFSYMLSDFSYFPLHFLYWLGLITTSFSFFISSFYLFKYLTGSPMVGFTSVILLLSFILGVLSLGLGIIGKYIIRIISRIDNIPTYSIKKII